MTDHPKPKVVLITGAAGGLGRGLVEVFLKEDWQVIATSHHDAKWAPHQKLASITMDVADGEQISAVVADSMARFGRIDCLIHNAGTTADGLSWSVPDESWEEIVNVNLKAGFLCARAISRHMIKARSGQIILISSFAGKAGVRGQAPYAAAKAGLLGLTQSLARELGSRNIRVNAVLPGILPTAMTAGLNAEQLNEYRRANTLGRINAVDEVARFIAFLATTQNISGQIFQLDSRIAPWT
jgi:3-oxoacyl-[acyl-carrier protein] reductase